MMCWSHPPPPLSLGLQQRYPSHPQASSPFPPTNVYVPVLERHCPCHLDGPCNNSVPWLLVSTQVNISLSTRLVNAASLAVARCTCGLLQGFNKDQCKASPASYQWHPKGGLFALQNQSSLFVHTAPQL